MKGCGPESIISLELIHKWENNFLFDNLFISFGLFYVLGLRNSDIFEAMKSSPNFRPWQHSSGKEMENWFPNIRCSDSEEIRMFNLLYDFWYKVFLQDEHLEVKFSPIDGLGLYSKIKDLKVTNLIGKKSTFLAEISSKNVLEELKSGGFNSLYEYDAKVYALYGFWMLANRSLTVEVGFVNYKPNGQTMQAILNLNTISYISNDNNKKMRTKDSILEFTDIPPLHIYSIKNTQDINEDNVNNTPNGTTFNYINKAYKIVDIDIHYDSKFKIGHVIRNIGQQLYINYQDIEVEYEEESQEVSLTPKS